MASDPDSFHDLSDNQLLAHVRELAAGERTATARLIAALAELDARRLHLGEGCSSLFTYCTQVLHLSEHAAYGRIEAARTARRYPVILEMVADGSITLTTVSLLSTHLTPGNYREVLDSARHKSKRQVEQIVAALRPLPPVLAVVRKLPEPRRGLLDDVTVDRAVVGEGEERRVHRELLRHSIPNGDPAAIFERALALLVADLERRKLAATTRPRAGREPIARGRRIPAAIRRAVWGRDAGQCAFVGNQGRCAERGFLEFHHVIPYAAGGSTSVENLQLRCRSHNAYEAERYFGDSIPSLLRETPSVDGLRTRSGPSWRLLRTQKLKRIGAHRLGGWAP